MSDDALTAEERAQLNAPNAWRGDLATARARIAELEAELKMRSQRCDNWAADCSDLRTRMAQARAELERIDTEFPSYVRRRVDRAKELLR